jgi:hypothetical protein
MSYRVTRKIAGALPLIAWRGDGLAHRNMKDQFKTKGRVVMAGKKMDFVNMQMGAKKNGCVPFRALDFVELVERHMKNKTDKKLIKQMDERLLEDRSIVCIVNNITNLFPDEKHNNIRELLIKILKRTYIIGKIDGLDAYPDKQAADKTKNLKAELKEQLKAV